MGGRLDWRRRGHQLRWFGDRNGPRLQRAGSWWPQPICNHAGKQDCHHANQRQDTFHSHANWQAMSFVIHIASTEKPNTNCSPRMQRWAIGNYCAATSVRRASSPFNAVPDRQSVVTPDARISAPPPEREPSLARSAHARSREALLFSPRTSELPTRCEPGTARAPVVVPRCTPRCNAAVYSVAVYSCLLGNILSSSGHENG